MKLLTLLLTALMMTSCATYKPSVVAMGIALDCATEALKNCNVCKTERDMESW